MSVFDPLLYIEEEAGRSARWNFPAAVGTPLLEFAGLGTAVSLTYSFMAGLPVYEAPGDHPGFAGLDVTMQAAARQALAAWAAVANLSFTEVADAGDGGQLRFGREAMAAPGGYAEPPRYAYALNPNTLVVTDYTPVPWMGDIYLATAAANGQVAAGGFGRTALLQLIGHALGLKDPLDLTNTLPVGEANQRTTVMAADPLTVPLGLADPAAAGLPGNLGIVTVTGSAGDYAWVADSLRPAGPMLYDIAAMQRLYGANTATNAGDTSYAWAASARLLQTIWDGGGTDTIDASNQSLPSSIDLRAGHFSSIALRLDEAARRLEIPAFAVAAPTPSYDGVDNLAIAFGVTIENARGGAGDDSLLGNDAANRLEGGGGADTLAGGAGADTLEGGGGDDRYLVDSPATLVVEAAASGRDTLLAGFSLALPADVEVLVLAPGAGALRGIGGGAGETLLGNGAANTLLGGQGADSLAGGGGTDLLLGGAGNDTLDGASGDGEADRLHGGPGDESYPVDAATDLVVEAAGEGTDTVLADISGGGFVLPAEVEMLTLLGSTRLGAGNDLANLITGNAAANYLLGGGGADTLDGQGGADLLFGGAGADVFLFQRGCGGDLVGDFASGVDRLRLVGLGFGSFAEVQAAMSVSGGQAVIALGQGDSILLLGVTSLVAGDVVLG